MDVPLVTIVVEDEWNSVADATPIFKLAPNYARSSWDWIGLYKVTGVATCKGTALRLNQALAAFCAL